MISARRSHSQVVGARVDNLITGIRARLAGADGIDREFAAALRSLAASVRAGRSLASGCDDASRRVDGRVSVAFARCAARFRLGIGHPEALSALHDDLRLDTSRLLVDVLIVRHRSGGDLGDVCHRVACLVDERTRLRAEARSATAQARFTARAVLLLPALLVVVWWQLAPETLAQLTSVGGLLILSPAIVMLLVGILSIRKIAAASTSVSSAAPIDPKQSSSMMRKSVVAIAGNGPLSVQSVRLAAAVSVPSVVIAMSTSAPIVRYASGALMVCSLVWPWARAQADVRTARDLVDSGIDTLLEVSIGLLAAGAAPRAVATGAIAACPGSLGRELGAQVAQIELGRSVESALGSSNAVRASPELDAWVHALTRDARHGAAATDTLEHLLTDVRTRQREQLRARAATAGPRMQLATVLLVVPAILWFVLVATGLGLVRQLQSAGMLG